MSFYVGNYKEDSNDHHRGWIVGSFMEEEPRRTDLVEVKYWQVSVGDKSHPAKTSGIYECTMIIEGHCTALIGDEVHELKAGSYVVIAPNTINNVLQEVHESTTGITIKAPSDPTAKKVIGVSE